MITITLRQIRIQNPRRSVWGKIKAAHVKDYGMDDPIKMSAILDRNDIGDVIRCVECFPEYNSVLRDFSRWCALQNIELIKPYCSDEDYKSIVLCLESPSNADSIRPVDAFRSVSAAIEIVTDSHTGVENIDADAAAAYAVYSAVTADTDVWYSVRAASTAAAFAYGSSKSTEAAQENKLRELLDNYGEEK